MRRTQVIFSFSTYFYATSVQSLPWSLWFEAISPSFKTTVILYIILYMSYDFCVCVYPHLTQLQIESNVTKRVLIWNKTK